VMHDHIDAMMIVQLTQRRHVQNIKSPNRRTCQQDTYYTRNHCNVHGKQPNVIGIKLLVLI
jgi:hypothetical protein